MKQKIRLTEGDLKRIIKESVKMVLKEGHTTYGTGSIKWNPKYKTCPYCGSEMTVGGLDPVHWNAYCPTCGYGINSSGDEYHP